MEPAHKPILYLICGKIAAGKSTLAHRLAARPATLLISEDHWTSNLFADELRTIDDYTRCSVRLRAAIGPHIVDSTARYFYYFGFPGKHFRVRSWMRWLIDQSGAPMSFTYSIFQT